MTFGQSVLRALFRSREDERMEWREAMRVNAAQAEDLCRTLQTIDGTELSQRLNGSVARAMKGMKIE